MDAAQVLARIDELEHELGALRKQEPGAADEVRGKLAADQRELDGLWDLRRRQQAAKEAGQPQPQDVRSAGTVEQYRQ